MKTEKKLTLRRRRRDFRIGNRVRRSARGKLRLSVFRSNKHIYAQVIDDSKGHTLVAASSCEKEISGTGDKETARKVGSLLGKRAVEKGISEVTFDRGNSKYHGRVAALADAVRSCGLKF